MKWSPFPGSARVSRVPFCVSRKGRFSPSDETSAGTRGTRALPGIFLAQATLPPEFKPFAGRYDIPFLPLWAVIVLTVLATLIVVALVWWLRKRWKHAHTPPPPPRQAALDSLNALQPHIDTDAPSEFTVEVASVLRRFVVGQYGIPATRQTSQEFLQSLAQSATFSESDQTLLKSFLDKSDLIEFAKLQATSADNRELWDKARQFVQGGQTP
ncbi:MAG: DUF4381 family protein [Chthoniobacterales bacterium]